jgi:hypothetical protein
VPGLRTLAPSSTARLCEAIRLGMRTGSRERPFHLREVVRLKDLLLGVAPAISELDQKHQPIAVSSAAALANGAKDAGALIASVGVIRDQINARNYGDVIAALRTSLAVELMDLVS